MHLPELITVQPNDYETIIALAHMMGESFLEENWTREWLSALDRIGATDARKLEISRAILENNFIVGSPYEACYMLPCMSAGAGAYLQSDLQGQTWNDLEDLSTERMAEFVLCANESELLIKRAEEMKPISNFHFANDHAGGNDFIHFYALGVDVRKRGSGTFRRLISPFLIKADALEINCYLECYSERLQGLYTHFGFKTVEIYSDSKFETVEYCMVREPQR